MFNQSFAPQNVILFFWIESSSFQLYDKLSTCSITNNCYDMYVAQTLWLKLDGAIISRTNHFNITPLTEDLISQDTRMEHLLLSFWIVLILLSPVKNVIHECYMVAKRNKILVLLILKFNFLNGVIYFFITLFDATSSFSVRKY